MLKLFRKKIVMKIVLWGLVIMVVPAFVMWGGASMSRSKDKGPGYVGLVYGKKISFDELSNALMGVRSQIILNYFNQPKVLDALLSNRPILVKLAWDRVLMLEEAKRAGIKISDKEVIEALRGHPLFTRNGAFDDKFYSYVLRNSIGLEARAFEEIVRENIALQKLSESLTKDIKLSDDDILSEYKKEFSKIKIAYILLEPKNYTSNITIDENTVKDFYEKHKSELMVKSKLKGALPDRPATFEESKVDIEKFLKEVEARKTLKEKSEGIYKELSEKSGANLESFVSAGQKAGLTVKETELFSKKDTVEAIGDAPFIIESARKLKDFELSGPLDINKGYIIFEVIDRKPADEDGFAKEKEEYSKKVRAIRSNLIMEDWLKGLEDKAKLEIKLEEIDKYYR